MAAGPSDPPMRLILEEAFNRGEFAAFDERLAPDSVSHIMAWGLPNNRLGLRQLIESFRLAFPDLRCTVEDEISSGDGMAARWTMRGTHTGLFFGNQPTGRTISVAGILFAHTDAGRIVEDWILVDQYGVLQQLGLVPPPRGP